MGPKTRPAAKAKPTAPHSAPAKPVAAKLAAAQKSPTTKPARAVVETAPVAAPEAMDSGLTPADLAEFRQALIDKRAQILGDVNALQEQALGSSEQSNEQSRMPVHMAELGSDNFEHEFTLGLIEGERAVLREIEDALDRLEAGTYGVCAATGRPIGKSRLKAKPWAKYCYEYMLAQEKGQRRV